MAASPISMARALCGCLALALAGVAQAAEGAPRSIYPGDLGQAVAAILIFVVLLAVLGRWAWRPLVTQVRNREQAIADAIERASKQQSEAQELLSFYRSRLDQAEEESKQLLDRTRKEAADLRDQIVTEARHEARQAAEAARAELERAKAEALRDVYHATADLATEIAQRLLRKTLSPEDHQRLLRESMAEIHDRAAGAP